MQRNVKSGKYILVFFLGNCIGDSEKVLSVPLGKRLESLDSDDEQDIMQEMADTKIQKQLPKTGSLEVLLSQYLETGDYLQIENVLNVDDKKVPHGTVFIHF